MGSNGDVRPCVPAPARRRTAPTTRRTDSLLRYLLGLTVHAAPRDRADRKLGSASARRGGRDADATGSGTSGTLVLTPPRTAVLYFSIITAVYVIFVLWITVHGSKDTACTGVNFCPPHVCRESCGVLYCVTGFAWNIIIIYNEHTTARTAQ